MSTQIKEIALTGLSTSPSDYDCEDGNLANALGVIHEDGAIINSSSSAPKLLSDMGTDDVLYQHSNAGYDHIIFKSGDDYYWQDAGEDSYDEDNKFAALSGVDVTKAISIGNTLVFYSDSNVYYYLWSTDETGDPSYVFLGNVVPDFSMSFGLISHPYRALEDMHGHLSGDDSMDQYINNLTTIRISESDSTHLTPEERMEPFTQAAFADVNYFQGNWCSKNGYFSQPFIVRYALRLFDGTLTKHSAPILMIPSTALNPRVFIMAISSLYSDGEEIYCIDTVGIAASLRYMLGNLPDGMDQWRDIISSIEIFVSAPIYTYDQSGTVTLNLDYTNPLYFNKPSSLHTFMNEGKTCSSDLDIETLSTSQCDQYRPIIDALNYENRFDIQSTDASTPSSSYNYDLNGSAYVAFYNSSITKFYLMPNRDMGVDVASSGYAPGCYIKLPERNLSAIIKDIRECSTFYNIKSIEFADIIDGNIPVDAWQFANIEEGVLGSLTSRETMTDDYDSHHKIIPSGISSYNNRLNIFNVTKYFFEGYPAKEMYQRIYRSSDDNTTYFTDLYTIIYINDEATIVLCKQHSNLNMAVNAPTDYFFYPDPSARRVVQFAVRADGAYFKRSFELIEHNGLNGAIHFKTLDASIWTLTDEADWSHIWNDVKGKDSISYQNLVYTSEATNPFVFSAANVEQIGNGEIIAMVPAAQALSQGQFGDFPMYAFTTEGIWALYPNDTGGWSSKQPISRDVVLSADAILQMDNSVVFATARGLMEINGSRVTCISEVFDGTSDMFADAYGNHVAHLLANNADYQWDGDMAVSFRDFLDGCNMHYDYRHQRIIIGNEDYPISFVFGMKDKLWTTIPLKVCKAINSYPQAYAMACQQGSNLLIDFAENGTASYLGVPECGFILTRPLKLDSPDVLKTIRKVIARGYMQRTSVDVILYGSRDLRNWLIIGNSKGNELVNRHGTAFKYFRVGLITRLEEGESLSGLTIEYEYKQNDKVR